VTTTQAKVIDLDSADRYQKLLGGAPETRGMRSGRQAIAPGAACGEHSTGAHEEVLVVLDGEGTARLGDGAELAVHGGQVVYVPPNTTHDIVNTGKKTLRYIYVVAPILEE
jgi:mannose-6-phosphate isomerase-like protein (cupin superfamily)